jgi:hypothetical protein
MNVSRYNAKDCSVLVNGTYITGLGEDMISWEKEEAYFEKVVGAQGDIIKSEINNTIHTLTLTVQPTSPQFSYLVDLQNKGATFPVWVINKALGIRLGGTMASIEEAPEISLGSEAEDLEFKFCVFDGVTESTK